MFSKNHLEPFIRLCLTKPLWLIPTNIYHYPPTYEKNWGYTRTVSRPFQITPGAKLPKANTSAQRNRTTTGLANSHSHCPNITRSLEAQKLGSKATGFSTSLLSSGSWLTLACVMLQQMWVLGSARQEPFYRLCFSCLLALHNSILGSSTWTMGAEEIVPSVKCLPCKLRNLRWSPRTQAKSQVWQNKLVTQALGR